MKEIKTISNTIVTLVTLPETLSILDEPKLGDYDNKYIKKTVPCEKVQGRFYDLRSGKEVKKSGNTKEWRNLTGTVFQYPDGKMLLITHRYRKNFENLCVEMTPDEFHPETMLMRPVIAMKKNDSH